MYVLIEVSFCFRPSESSTTDVQKLNFQCVECGRWYREVEGLQAHVRLYHGKSDNRPRSRGTRFLTIFSRICETCNKEVELDDIFHKHEDADPSFILRCKECSIDFKETSDAKVHWKFRHINKVKRTVINYPKRCLFCPVMVASFKDNEKHIDQEHADLKRYTCDVCGKSFLREGYLRVHKDIHAGKRNYICQYCGRGFINSVNLVSTKVILAVVVWYC